MKFINSIIENQKLLFFYYLLVLITPNIVLLFTQNYTITTSIITILLPLSFYSLFLNITKNHSKMFLYGIPFSFLCAFEIVIIKLFSGSYIAADMFTNLFTTNAGEAGELLGSLMPAVIFVIVWYGGAIAIAIYSLVIKSKKDNVFRRKNIKISFITLLIAIALTIFQTFYNPIFKFTEQVFPINVFRNFGISINRWSMSNDFLKLSEGFKFDSKRGLEDIKERQIYVFILGETSRAENFSLFGYHKETNPNLKKVKNLITVQDFVTESNTTHKIVPLILSSINASNFDDIYYRKSILTAFKEAGFKTYFISNQKPNKSFTDYYAQEADFSINLTNEGQETAVDGVTLEELDKALNKTNEDLFIVIHTYGSHFNFRNRYPEEFARFTPDNTDKVSAEYSQQITNAYDNSILYADYVISEVINKVDSTNSISSVIYLSDHGEDIYDDSRNRFLHASPTTTYYQLHVPFIGWFSDKYIETFNEKYNAIIENCSKPASSGALFHTMVDIANIKTPYLTDSLSLVSKSFNQNERYYLNDYYKPILMINTGLEDIDIEMIDKKGIKYDKSSKLKLVY